jgi:hypothetical protein
MRVKLRQAETKTGQILGQLLSRQTGDASYPGRFSRNDSSPTSFPLKSVLLNRYADGRHKGAQDYRQIRDAVLLAAYEIEYSLGLLITELFFPQGWETSSAQHPTLGVDHGKLRVLFADCFLKTGPLSFRTKVDTLKIAASRLPVLGKLVPRNFIARLRQVIDLRNRFALHPVTFTLEPPHESLHASLVCRDKKIVLDQAFLRKTDRLFHSTSDSVKNILSRVRSDVDRIKN